MGGRSKGVTAAELAARLSADPDFVAAAAARETERQARAAEWREAEQPIIADLSGVGITVDSVWDLVNTSEPYPAALPVLMEHLERGEYPDRVMEGIGRALAVQPSEVFWERLTQLYLASRSPGEEEGVALALAASATEEHLQELIDLLDVDQRGESRIYFLRPIARFGGDHARRLLEELRGDETFGREAASILAE